MRGNSLLARLMMRGRCCGFLQSFIGGIAGRTGFQKLKFKQSRSDH